MLRRKLRAMLMSQQNKDKGRIYLYNQGDTCDSVTGGWSVLNGDYRYNNQTGRYEWKPSEKVHFKEDNIHLESDADRFRLSTNNKLNTSGKKVCIQVQEIGTHGYMSDFNDDWLAINLNTTNVNLSYSNPKNNTNYYKVTTNHNTNLVVKRLDVAEGEFYIQISTGYGEYRIDKIWLEDK